MLDCGFARQGIDCDFLTSILDLELNEVDMLDPFSEIFAFSFWSAYRACRLYSFRNLST